MKDLQFPILAVLLVFTSGMLQAQTVGLSRESSELSTQTKDRPNQRMDHSDAPGWDDFRRLSERLDALDAENNRLREQLAVPDTRRLPTVMQASYQAPGSDYGCDDHPACGDCSWVDQICSTCKEGLSWNKGQLRIVPFGYAAADMIASEKAYTLLGGPLFLLPAVPPGIPDSRFTFTAQQTTVGFNITGPDLGAFQSGAVVAFNFFGDRPVQNNPGVFFLLGYLQLQNERWRLWAGQDPDAIGRQNTNSPAWTSHKQSGNFGQIRPGFRAERFFRHSDVTQTSIYVGLTQQVVLDFIALPQVAGTDNGWPNVEMRWEVSLGPESDVGRPFMFAVGGFVGETRAVDFVGRPLANVSTTWAVVPELRTQIGRWGFHGEAFVGDALGTYNGGIGQSLNLLTDEAIYTAGGFGELFCNITPAFTVSVGYGIDDPRDTDLAINQRARNETYWTNAIWRLSEQWESRFEIARQRTNYIAPSVSSKAIQFLVSLRYNF